jgi:flagellar biosynthetic protein FliP
MAPIETYLTAAFSLLLFTSFIKIFTSLSILRYGLGLTGAGFSVVFFTIALAFAALTAQGGGEIATATLLFGKPRTAAAVQDNEVRPFLVKQVDPALVKQFTALAQGDSSSMPSAANQEVASKDIVRDAPLRVLVAAFVLTEVQRACILGALFLIPFIVIDLIVAHALTALGITQLSAALVSLPIKLIFFISVDGWSLVINKIFSSL